MQRIGYFCAAAVVAVSATVAWAQSTVPEKIAPPLPTPAPRSVPTPTASPSTQAFKAVDNQMMTAMNRPMTGDPDQDFVGGMLPHHRGAVAMAQVELQYGKDPELRRLAQAIVAAQEQEIAQMRSWQEKHPEQP